MPLWDADQYLKFEEARTGPCRELVGRISLPSDEVQTALDLGCGPGNSTAVLMERYAAAHVLGVDSSAEMLLKARGALDDRGAEFVHGDLETWQPTPDLRGKIDVILSNALFQWVPGHAEIFPRMMAWLRKGGELAVQMPRSYHLPVLQLIRETAAAGPWAKTFEEFSPPAIVHEPREYYDWLAEHTKHIDIWETVYQHVMPDAQGVVEWSKGTGLRPYLEKAGEQREAFLAEYARRIEQAYPPRIDGRVLMEFRRLFIIAKR